MNQELTLIFDTLSEQGLPFHFRSCLSPFRNPPDSPPSRVGLDELRISGSEQPSPSEIGTILKELGPKVAVFDLREESHCFVDNHPVSWFGQKNWANLGKNLEQVLADEQARIRALPLPGTLRLTHALTKDEQGLIDKAEVSEVYCQKSQSEQTVVDAAGLTGQRIPVTDHSPPKVSDVDRFLGILRETPPDVWLHFHCHAGDGRTTTFMLLTDMLRNAARLGLEELALRQHLIGGVDLLHFPHTGWKDPLYRERAAFVTKFYSFARQSNWRELDWSQYLAQNP